MKTTEGIQCNICGRFYSDPDEDNYPHDVLGPNDPGVWDEPGALEHVCGLCYTRIDELRKQLRAEYIRELAHDLEKSYSKKNDGLKIKAKKEQHEPRKSISENKMGRPKIDIDLARIDRLRSEGQTLTDIAEGLGIAKSTLDRRLWERRENQKDTNSIDKAGDDLAESEKSILKGGKGRPQIVVDLDRLLELKKEGKTNQEIAELTGTSKSTIEKRIRDLSRNIEPECPPEDNEDIAVNEDISDQEEETLLSAELIRRDLADDLDSVSSSEDQEEHTNTPDEEDILSNSSEEEIDEIAKGKKSDRSSRALYCPVCDNEDIQKGEIVYCQQTYICLKCEARFIRKTHVAKWNAEILKYIAKLKAESTSNHEIVEGIKRRFNVKIADCTVCLWMRIYEMLNHADPEKKIHLLDIGSNSPSQVSMTNEPPVSDTDSKDEPVIQDKEPISNPNPRVNERRVKRRQNLTNKGETKYLERLEKEDEYMERHLQEIESSDDKSRLCLFCKERYVEDPGRDHCDICEAAFEMNTRAEAREK